MDVIASSSFRPKPTAQSIYPADVGIELDAVDDLGEFMWNMLKVGSRFGQGASERVGWDQCLDTPYSVD